MTARHQHILCPVDFSECSGAALRTACRLAKADDALLYIVHVEEVPMRPLPGERGYLAELDENRRLLQEATPCFDDVRFEQHYLKGNVVDEILRFATLRDVDLIVLGTRGRTGLAKLLLGSTAESIMRGAECQVMAVQHDDSSAPSQDDTIADDRDSRRS